MGECGLLAGPHDGLLKGNFTVDSGTEERMWAFGVCVPKPSFRLLESLSPDLLNKQENLASLVSPQISCGAGPPCFTFLL